MTNAEIAFIYNGTETTIQTNTEAKFKDICSRFLIKSLKEKDSVFFIYSGNRIDENKNFKETANEEDKTRNKMIILVYDTNNPVNPQYLVTSKETICPVCKDNAFIEVNNYKINLSGCNKKHSISNIFLQNYESMQKIDISSIKCGQCETANKSNTFKNEMHICLKCNINICPLCKFKHDKSHTIINYDLRNYICTKHNEIFTRFCSNCNLNLCMQCEKDHKQHNSIYFGDIVSNDNSNEDLTKSMIKIKEEIQNIINKLNNIISNLEIYYNINKQINENKNRNYASLKNISELRKFNNIVINDINSITSENDINQKFDKLMNIYEKINNNNYIIAEMEIKREDINRNIRILNSFEAYKRENRRADKSDDYLYNNEKEIKESIQIRINNEIIPFNYFYKFNKEGKYTIQYMFKKKIKKTVFMFLGCKSLIKIDLSNFNMEDIDNMNAMFYGCDSLDTVNLSNPNTHNINNIGCLFYECKKLKNLNLSNFHTENVNNMNGLFAFCESLRNIDLSSFDTKNVNNMCCLFRGCKNLTNIDLSKFNTEKVNNMNSMFYECESLTSIDVSKFKTNNVIDLGCMFGKCKVLKTLNLSNFNTGKVKDMNGMFSQCDLLNSIDLSNFNTQNVANMNYLFKDCMSLRKDKIKAKDQKLINYIINNL